MADSKSASDRIYVGFWLRVGAALIDSALLLFLLFPLLSLIPGASSQLSMPRLRSPDGHLDYAALAANMPGPLQAFLFWVLPAIVVVIFWLSREATPGKMAIRARIVDANHCGRPTTRQCIIRYLGYYIATFPLGLGLIWVGFDARKQGWHDKLAGTLVLRTAASTDGSRRVTAKSPERNKPGWKDE